MSRPLLLAGVFMALFVLAVGLASAAKPPPVQNAVEAKPNAIDKDGFELLPDPIWRPERIRWCGLIELAANPARAGKSVSTALEVGRKEGATFLIWHFYDEANQLTLTTESSQCFSQVNVSNDEGNYRFPFTLPTDVPDTDAAKDAASIQTAAWAQCRVEHPERLQSDVTVATVVDTDGKVWTSDGTREKGDLRSCLALAHHAYVSEQVAAGTLSLTAPAVVFGTVPKTPAGTTPVAPLAPVKPKP